MGCWGTGTFENDDALDWAFDLGQNSGMDPVQRVLRAPCDGDNLEAPDACEALAAAEIVAALLGRPASDLPVDVARWIAEHRGLDARPYREVALAHARAALGNNSELRELWAENEPDFPFWKATVEALIARLSSAG
jgi:hypothetical protein